MTSSGLTRQKEAGPTLEWQHKHRSLLTGCVHVNVKARRPLLFLRKHFLSDVLRDNSGRWALRAPDATSLSRKVVEGAGHRKLPSAHWTRASRRTHQPKSRMRWWFLNMENFTTTFNGTASSGALNNIRMTVKSGSLHCFINHPGKIWLSLEMKSAGSHCGYEEEDDKNNNTFSSVLHLSDTAGNMCTAPHWHLPSLWVTLQRVHEHMDPFMCPCCWCYFISIYLSR